MKLDQAEMAAKLADLDDAGLRRLRDMTTIEIDNRINAELHKRIPPLCLIFHENMVPDVLNSINQYLETYGASYRVAELTIIKAFKMIGFDVDFKTN